MYTVISNYYGSLTTKQNLEEAIYWGKSYKEKEPEDAVITIWQNREKIMTIE